jgi:hypothetical protein
MPIQDDTVTNEINMTKEIMLTPNQIHSSDDYDPDHPDADWSGFVSIKSCRKHIPSQANQLVPLDGNGFGPRNGVATAEWTKPARKSVGHRESGADNTCEKTQSSTFTLICGPIPETSPSKFASECWETEARAAARKKKTGLEQLTHHGRSMYIKGRKSKDAAEDGQHEVLPTRSEPSPPKDSSDFTGFRSSNARVSCSDTSFLAEVGEAVAKFRGSSSSFSTDSATSFDPYMTASGGRRKDLILENFSSTVPGYTGKRTFTS